MKISNADQPGFSAALDDSESEFPASETDATPKPKLVTKAYLAFRHNPLGLLGIFLLALVIFMALFAPYIAPYDPVEFNIPDRGQAPSSQHIFGTDAFGRDIFSRVVYGSRISLRVVLIVLSIAVVVGVIIGASAGFFGGLLDEVFMRLTDMFLSFPALILALAVNAALGPGINQAMLAVALVWWPGYARMIRGQVISAKNKPHVEAARAIGASQRRILTHHILPSSINPTLVEITLDAGFVVLVTAGLSFMGLGAQPPSPEWGRMVTEGRAVILTAWWWSTFPGLAIMVLVVGFNLTGDFIRDILDPKTRQVALGARK